VRQSDGVGMKKYGSVQEKEADGVSYEITYVNDEEGSRKRQG